MCGTSISRRNNPNAVWFFNFEIIKPLYALIVVFTGMLTGDFIIFSVGRKCRRRLLRIRNFTGLSHLKGCPPLKINSKSGKSLL
jgi:hypothetical protein